MARKSPRSRRKPDPAPRVPGAGRPISKPGRKRPGAKPAKLRAASATHAPKGARPASGSRSRRIAPAAGARTPRRPATRTIRRAAPAVRTAAAPGSRGRIPPPDPARVAAILVALDQTYPGAHTELAFRTPLQLLVATILSAQCTDERVNMVTPRLFERYPDAAALGGAAQEEVEEIIRSTGFFRMKGRAIREAAADVAGRHAGEVPRTMEELTALRGVGRKTANVVLGNAYGIPGLVVDTHVSRVSYRLGLTQERDPVKIEHALMEIIPRGRWTIFSHWLILHGRRICNARKPYCSRCPLLPHCPRLGVKISQ